MLNIKIRSLGLADYCLIGYMLLSIVFIRARIGLISAYTLFPLWLILTWGTSYHRLMQERKVARVFWAFLGFIVFVIFQRFWCGFEYEPTVLLLKNYIAAFYGWFAITYYLHKGQEDKLKLFALVMLAVVVVNALWNYYMESIVPFASRAATGGTLERQMDMGGGINWDLVEVLSSGVVTFYGMITTAILIPVTVYLAFHSGRVGILFLLVSAIFFISVLRASYMLSLLYIAVGLYLALCGLGARVSVRPVWVITLVVLVILFTSLLVVAEPVISYLETLAISSENEVYRSKLNDIRAAIQTGDMSYFPRLENYLISFNTIRSNPLFGVGFDVTRSHTGGHSEILDMVAQIGLIGFLPYLLFFYVVEKYYRAFTDGRSRCVSNLRYILWAPLLLASFTNPTKGYEIWFSYFFTVPALSLFIKPRYRDTRLSAGSRPKLMPFVPQRRF